MTYIHTYMTEIPEIAGTPLVTDGEDNIIKAINKRLPEVLSLRCWNHLLSAARHWLKKHGATTAECNIYTQDINELLMSPSEDDYREMYAKLSGRWSRAFVEYFYSQLAPKVVSTCGRWILEPLGVYNGYSGVTTNQSEGFNTFIKQLVMTKEKSPDSLAFALYHLQCYFKNEVQRGLAGLGQYLLREQFQGLAISMEAMELEHCCLMLCIWYSCGGVSVLSRPIHISYNLFHSPTPIMHVCSIPVIAHSLGHNHCKSM